jgi:hypothetical protein
MVHKTPAAETYIDHHPETGDLVGKSEMADSYVDHKAKAGDLRRQ